MSMTQTAIRLDTTTIARADGLVDAIERRLRNGPATRSDVLRVAVELGLDALEHDDRARQLAQESAR
jgi:outer membrane protein TolC